MFIYMVTTPAPRLSSPVDDVDTVLLFCLDVADDGSEDLLGLRLGRSQRQVEFLHGFSLPVIQLGVHASLEEEGKGKRYLRMKLEEN